MFGPFGSISRSGRLAAAALGALMLAGCAGQMTKAPANAKSESISQVVMTVESVNRETRQAVLIGPKGQRVGVAVAPAAGSLAGVDPGDLVQVVLVERSVARLAKASDVDGGALAMTVVGQRDGLPARDDRLATRRVVEIVSVTDPGDAVRYRLPGGDTESILVDNAANRAFARSLVKGDRVVIDTVITVTMSTIGA